MTATASRTVRTFLLAAAGAAAVFASGSCAPSAVGSAVTGAGAADSAGEERLLDELAERERSSGFRFGMGLAESSARERAGDYAGAVAAAFKELSYARAFGLVDEKTVRGRLSAVAGAFKTGKDTGTAAASATADACADFLSGDWSSARRKLRTLFPGEDEPDSFPRWMILACDLELAPGGRAARNAYASVRARYAGFPEYWLRASRGGTPETAERCLSLAPAGPFAAEARALMAAEAGISPPQGGVLLCRSEIEEFVRTAAAASDPTRLESLYPLLSLPDNRFTEYAVGALRGLASAPAFREALAAEGKKRKGLLGERLRRAGGS